MDMPTRNIIGLKDKQNVQQKKQKKENRNNSNQEKGKLHRKNT